MRVSALSVLVLLAACGSGDDDAPPGPLDPDTAPRVVVDRFSGEPAGLLDRAVVAGLPGPDEPIDFDAAPFLVRGLGPAGERTVHYHLDVQHRVPIQIFVLYREGESLPLLGQLPLAGYIPGDHGYTDFWRVVRVDVPADYVPNTITSVTAVNESGFPTTVTDSIVNCPVVPVGSTATRRRGSGASDTGLHRGWYRDQVFYYFTFEETPLMPDEEQVPVADLYASFNGNSVAGGFMTETGSDQTHSVAAALDGAGYSSLWSMQVYDNAAFASVTDLASAQAAPIVEADAILWNAPIVEVVGR